MWGLGFEIFAFDLEKRSRTPASGGSGTMRALRDDSRSWMNSGSFMHDG